MSSDNYYYVDYDGEDFFLYHMFYSDEGSPAEKYKDMNKEPLRVEGVSKLYAILSDPNDYTEYPPVYSASAKALLMKRILRD